MIESQLEEAPAGSWWSRLIQAILREPSVVLLEKEAEALGASDNREAPLRRCEGVR
ncbi:hypothetical protein MOK15_10155 [Sphingobium sp. BYY-5]|uniref:hypothetical protein n=1 Tax=Sphingobium sp. BYY-5 TaxID=2926400 RepID=UPI001FA7D92F|nr:hypothetical protein [Sphingobium sp. BYY-5]MCI4590457.1 hypothetical protein [Sphingobium sp. BYY-5]